jgi:hypothetical protein
LSSAPLIASWCKQMKLTSSVSVILLSAAAALLSPAWAGRSKANILGDLTARFFDDQHYEKIARQKNRNQHRDEGYQILPPKASPAQCNLALQRITQQPRSCAEQYMARTARNVYLPVYNWFKSELVQQTAITFSLENGVSIIVKDVYGYVLASSTPLGVVSVAAGTGPESVPFAAGRTTALNYPTFVREEGDSLGRIAQVVYSDDAQTVLVEITMPLIQLPVVC